MGSVSNVYDACMFLGFTVFNGSTLSWPQTGQKEGWMLVKFSFLRTRKNRASIGALTHFFVIFFLSVWKGNGFKPEHEVFLCVLKSQKVDFYRG